MFKTIAATTAVTSLVSGAAILPTAFAAFDIAGVMLAGIFLFVGAYTGHAWSKA